MRKLAVIYLLISGLPLPVVAGVSLDKALGEVNRFYNQLNFVSDSVHWGREDFWATPLEFVQSRGGDCEDFAIAKYMTLRALGVPMDNLRLIFVNIAPENTAHMVLGYMASPGKEPIILDNLTDRILPLSRRRNLEPVYSFNDRGIWLGVNSKRVGSVDQLGQWQELKMRLRGRVKVN